MKDVRTITLNVAALHNYKLLLSAYATVLSGLYVEGNLKIRLWYCPLPRMQKVFRQNLSTGNYIFFTLSDSLLLFVKNTFEVIQLLCS
jgi:hypothetical protein